jgi:hypothetical protein
VLLLFCLLNWTKINQNYEKPGVCCDRPGGVISLSPPNATEENFEWPPFFIISRSEMMKNGGHSKKYYLAEQAAK